MHDRLARRNSILRKAAGYEGENPGPLRSSTDQAYFLGARGRRII